MQITKRPLFYWIISRHRILQAVLLLIILVSLFFRVYPLEMQKRIINEAINLHDTQLLFLYCGLYIGAVLLAGITKYVINVMQTIIGQKILVEMRTQLYQHILQLPLQFYRTMQPGTVISAMTAELNAIGFFLGGALAIPITSVLTFAVFLGFMFTLSPLLAFLSMTVYPLEIIIIPLLQKKYNRLNAERIKTTRAMSNVVNEAISGIHEVHSNASYSLEGNRLKSFIDSLYATLKRLFFVKYGIKFANNLFQSVGPFILFLVGGYLAIHGQFTLGALVAFLSAYEKVYDPWKEMIEYYQNYQDAKVRYAQIMEIFDVEIPHPRYPESGEPKLLDGSIELNQASFTVGHGVKLLDKITMQAKPNEQIALVGFSGSGKSTLALLMAQLYDASSGSVLIGGSDIESLSKADMSRNVTMISQAPFIFSGTIRDNLLYSVQASGTDPEDIPREKLFEVIRDVGLEDNILTFGFNSVLPSCRVAHLREKILRMRRIIHEELAEEFDELAEFYDGNSFLTFSSLRDNLIFGETQAREYGIDALPTNKAFRRFLGNMELEEPLIQLGIQIAQATINLLQDLADDEFFFSGTPMKPKDLKRYGKILNEQQNKKRFTEESKNRMLRLALQFIPGRHNITSLPQGMAEAIVAARHVFLKDIVKIDLEACLEQTSVLENRGLSLPMYGGQQNFIAYCPSEYLPNHSLRDNILFGALKKEEKADKELVYLALSAFRREGLLDEILDIGLDFEVGSKGDRLSGGQKQKVAIARAFLKESPILIMDEATASLDNTSQSKIQNLLETRFKGCKTIIAVIHRLDLTPSYDKIIVLKNGVIIEQGTHEELMAKKGAFYELATGNA